MNVVGANVLNFCRNEAMYKQRNDDSKSNTKTRMIASWHEHHEQNMLASAPERKKNIASVQEELYCQRQELLARRSQKMRELYTEEGQNYANELRALGLVIFNGELPPKMFQTLYGQTAAALYAKAAGQNAQARQLYNASADTYYKANDAAAYDDWVRARNHWDYFYNRS